MVIRFMSLVQVGGSATPEVTKQLPVNPPTTLSVTLQACEALAAEGNKMYVLFATDDVLVTGVI